MKDKVTYLYTIKNDDMIFYQCFNYKEAQAAKVLYELEYDKKLKLSRVKYT